jgi:hypothetical protein
MKFSTDQTIFHLELHGLAGIEDILKQKIKEK